jgi:hypothetical protein
MLGYSVGSQQMATLHDEFHKSHDPTFGNVTITTGLVKILTLKNVNQFIADLYKKETRSPEDIAKDNENAKLLAEATAGRARVRQDVALVKRVALELEEEECNQVFSRADLLYGSMKALNLEFDSEDARSIVTLIDGTLEVEIIVTLRQQEKARTIYSEFLEMQEELFAKIQNQICFEALRLLSAEVLTLAEVIEGLDPWATSFLERNKIRNSELKNARLGSGHEALSALAKGNANTRGRRSFKSRRRNN